MAALMTIPTPG